MNVKIGGGSETLYERDGTGLRLWMYGIFWELRFRGHDRYPVRAYREASEMRGNMGRFKLYGPTCDATDVLPGTVDLPEDIGPGDYLEFGNMGAYSLSGRTSFNGHFSDDIAIINGGTGPAPALEVEPRPRG